MNGVHDMGGMHGFGPIEREANEPLFHAAWEARVRAIATLTPGAGYFNIDAFRYGIERMPPAEYLRASYFERWLASVEYNLIEQGLLTGDELDARIDVLPRASRRRPAAAGAVRRPRRRRRQRARSRHRRRRAALRGGRRGGDAQRPPGRPHAAAALRARQAGRRSSAVHGPQIFPDTNAHGLGEQPQVALQRPLRRAASCGATPPSRAQAVSSTCGSSYLDARRRP